MTAVPEILYRDIRWVKRWQVFKRPQTITRGDLHGAIPGHWKGCIIALGPLRLTFGFPAERPSCPTCGRRK